MITAYVIELLKTQNRVIIPDLGAFLINRSPSGDIISFNDFLKFNDGVLVNHMIKVEKISKTEAVDKIKDFIKQADKGFREQNRFDMEGLGFLYRDDRGNILLSTKQSDTPETKQLTEQPPVKEENQLNNAPEIEFAKTPLSEPPKSDTQKPGSFAASQETKVHKPLYQKPPYSTSKTTTMDSTKKIIIIASISLVVLAGILFSLVYFNVVSMEKLTFWKTKKAEIVQIAEPLPVADTTPVVQPEPVPVETPVAVVKYHVVAGSFKNQNYAAKFSEKLKQEGFNSTIVGPRNNFYVVTYASFEARKDAIAEYNRLKETHDQIWILKY